MRVGTTAFGDTGANLVRGHYFDEYDVRGSVLNTEVASRQGMYEGRGVLRQGQSNLRNRTR
jgi:hypothetical protein